jgi:hypothetical protein
MTIKSTFTNTNTNTGNRSKHAHAMKAKKEESNPLLLLPTVPAVQVHPHSTPAASTQQYHHHHHLTPDPAPDNELDEARHTYRSIVLLTLQRGIFLLVLILPALYVIYLVGIVIRDAFGTILKT